MFFPIKKFLGIIKSNLYWFLQGPYRPKEFWERWGRTFYTEPVQRKIYPQHNWILANLKKNKPKNLLEVGCGFGRNIKFLAKNYKYPIKVTGCDISTTMLEAARKYLLRVRFGNAKPELLQADILDLPFKDWEFDVVLLHGVLMHVKPENIEKAVAEASRCAKNYLIVVEQNFINRNKKDKKFQRINNYTFAYDYRQLFTQFGGKILDYQKTKDLDWLLVEV